MKDTTDFGYRDVGPAEKTRLVQGVFASVARRYDLMNDLMSGGIHRLWKRHFIATGGFRAGQQVLDLAGGTGDIAAGILRRVGPRGRVVVADLTRAMLTAGRERFDNAGRVAGIDWLQTNAEALPFPDASFSAVTIAFGLRNVTDRPTALAEMHRVLKPGGRVHILEFSKVIVPGLDTAYDAWSFGALPRLGRLVAGDEASYRYLAESIRRFPDQETLAQMLTSAGFERVDWENLSGGICAIHRGAKT